MNGICYGTRSLKMTSALLSKILFLLWMTQCRVAIKQQLDCGEVEKRYKMACEGMNITLACPKEKPWLQITSATFERKMSERQLCNRPGTTPNPTEPVTTCVQNVAAKVADICDGQAPCVFNVNNATFHDPCPEMYKYMLASFNCHCRRRYTRNARTTSTAKCIPRKPNSTSSTYTIIHPTPTLTTIGQSMSQNVTNSTYLPIRMTIKPTTPASTQSLTTAISVKESAQNITLFAQSVRGRNQAFFLLLELFVIYNEAANEDPPMALMWCFIGMLLGLFIMTITFLILGLRRKSKNKNIFRLSQLETEEGEIESPTIHTTSQFPESPDLDRRQQAVEKLASRGTNTPVGKHFPGMGSWSDLLKADTSLYINPLWRGWREEYLSLTAQGGEAELDTGQDEREGLSRSEPWNLSGVAETDDVDHRDGQGNSNGSNNSDGSSNRTSSNSNSSSQRNSGSDTNTIIDNNNNNNKQPDTSNTNPEQSKASTNNIDPSRVPTNKRRSITECDNLVNSIPVGIPSHPVPYPKIFHTEPTRTNKPEVSNTKPEVSITKTETSNTKPEVDENNGNQLKDEKPSTSTSNYKSPSNKLLSKFGLNIEDVCPTPSLCNTALSSPCLYNKDLSEELSRPGKQDLKGSAHPVTNSRLQVRSRPIRSRSLDLYSPSEITSLHHTYNPLHKPTSENPTAHSPTTQHQNNPPPFVKNRNSPSLWPNVLVHGKTNTQGQAQNGGPQDLPVTKPKKSPTDSRASSGYYSNNTSPLVEYPADITSSQNSGKKVEQRPQRPSSLKRQKLSNGDDDLPPLPPPPPPLIPISPLPHMCMSGYRGPRTKDENNLDKNPSSTAVRKVHFKSSEK